MNIPQSLKYTKEHEWVREDGDTVTVGITDHAQGELGDIIFVEFPEIGQKIEKDEPCGTIEAVKDGCRSVCANIWHGYRN